MALKASRKIKLEKNRIDLSPLAVTVSFISVQVNFYGGQGDVTAFHTSVGIFDLPMR